MLTYLQVSSLHRKTTFLSQQMDLLLGTLVCLIWGWCITMFSVFETGSCYNSQVGLDIIVLPSHVPNRFDKYWVWESSHW